MVFKRSKTNDRERPHLSSDFTWFILFRLDKEAEFSFPSPARESCLKTCAFKAVRTDCKVPSFSRVAVIMSASGDAVAKEVMVYFGSLFHRENNSQGEEEEDGIPEVAHAQDEKEPLLYNLKVLFKR